MTEPELAIPAEQDVELDLDAKRAAREEKEGGPRPVRLGGQVWLFLRRFPLEAGDELDAGRLAQAVRMMLVNDDDWERIRGLKLTDGDLTDIAEMYGQTPGESAGSAGRSPTAGPRSRRTSNGSTSSTSRKRAGVTRR